MTAAPASAPTLHLCRHCNRPRKTVGRGLCRTCHQRQTVRLMYAKAQPPDNPPCLHCHQRPGNRRYGLCWRCYESGPEVRAQYVPPRKVEEIPDYNEASKLPEPTSAPPGSAEKYAVLCERAAAGLALNHPGDAQRPLT